MVSKGVKASRLPPPKPRPIVVYVEGGGDSKNNNKELAIQARQAVSTLIKHGTNRDVHVVPCGSRKQTFDKFQTACCLRAERPVLLVDAEARVADITKPWAHLKARDEWIAPGNATDDHAFLMVETMETWLLADPDALGKAVGEGFTPNKIPKWPALESVPKTTLYATLESATRGCQTRYDKGRHSFSALMEVDTDRLAAACPSAARLFTILPGLK